MNEELELELSKIPQKVEEVSVEAQEKNLSSAIECAQAEEKLLARERRGIKDKLKIDIGFDRVVSLESELRRKLERNKKIIQLVNRQEKGLNRKDKRYCNIKQEIDNAKPNQIEEERLLRYINKEMMKQKEQEAELKQNARSIQIKAEKGQDLEVRIFEEGEELEELKREYQLQEENKRLSDPDNEFKDLTISELKTSLAKIQSERNAKKKTMQEEKAELTAELARLKESFNELSRKKKINGHRLQELTRLIKWNKDKTKKGTEQDKDPIGKALTTRSQRIKSYQAKMKGKLAFSVSNSARGSPVASSVTAKIDLINTNEVLIAIIT
eukprot:TRINITY_DN10703_c0_g1_i1.p2 TRINITY_DN10703_c0_g1~~TRINITY_DN10703_c0_g1_i1.p2  ORF type:complete len:327 (-),score=115.70 TRINITY_DN10703_c0_g1_i1:15-995(-)